MIGDQNDFNSKRGEKTTVNVLDLVVLAILSTTAIVIIGFVAKARHILNNDGRRGHSLLEIKPVPQPLKNLD
jgi:hypothetical protein